MTGRRSNRKRIHHNQHASKVLHTDYAEAKEHAEQATRSRPNDAPREVYQCWWHDEYLRGETAEPHWHVGRRPKRK